MTRPWVLPTARVETPAALLAAQPDLPAAFVARMATAEDIAFVGEANDRLKTLQAMLETLQAGGAGDKAEALKAAAGLDGRVTETYARQIEFVLRCVSEPELDRELVLWIGRHFPLFFSALFQAVMRLTGEGAQPGELPGSGATPPSEPV